MRRDLDPTAKGIEDGESLSDLSGGLAAFQLDQKPHSNTRGGRQLVLTQALSNPRLADDIAEILCRQSVFPIGKILTK